MSVFCFRFISIFTILHNRTQTVSLYFLWVSFLLSHTFTLGVLEHGLRAFEGFSWAGFGSWKAFAVHFSPPVFWELGARSKEALSLHTDPNQIPSTRVGGRPPPVSRLIDRAKTQSHLLWTLGAFLLSLCSSFFFTLSWFWSQSRSKVWASVNRSAHVEWEPLPENRPLWGKRQAKRRSLGLRQPPTTSIPMKRSFDYF